MNNNSFDINNINAFLKQASQVISCDQNCQQQKKANELKQIYLDSETNLKSAPNQVQVAKQNYISFTQGNLAYNNLQNEELQTKAESIANIFQKNFDQDIKEINLEIDTYNGLLINLKNVIELYLNYKKENRELEQELKDETSDVLTNERKTYYEDQGIDSLKYYYYILLVIYVIFVLGFGLSSFIYPSVFTWKIKLILFILFCGLPFISTWILSTFIYLIYKLYDLLPKNVHLSI